MELFTLVFPVIIPGVDGVMGCTAMIALAASLAHPLLNLVVTEYDPGFKPENILLV